MRDGGNRKGEGWIKQLNSCLLRQWQVQVLMESYEGSIHWLLQNCLAAKGGRQRQTLMSDGGSRWWYRDSGEEGGCWAGGGVRNNLGA